MDGAVVVPRIFGGVLMSIAVNSVSPPSIAVTRDLSIEFFIGIVIFSFHLASYVPLQPESFFYSTAGTAGINVVNTIPGLEYIKRICYIMMILNLAKGYKRIASAPILHYLGRNYDVALIYLFGALSIAWSFDPTISLNRLANDILLLSPVIYFIYVVRTPAQLVFFIYVSSAAMVIASLISILLFPDLAIHQVGPGLLLDSSLRGTWRGVFAHKNIAAGVAALSLNLSLIYVIFGRHRLINSAVCLLSILFIYGAESKAIYASSLMIVPLAIILSLYNQAQNISRAVCFVILGLTAAIPFLVVNWLYPAFDISLTDRALIWSAGFRLVESYPFAVEVGMGYAAAFGSGISFGLISSSNLPQLVGHSHSAIMEAYTQLGIVGCVLYLMFCANTMKIITFRASQKLDDIVTSAALFAILFVCIMRGWTEPDFLSSRAQWSVFLMIGIFLRAAQFRRRSSKFAGARADSVINE